MRRKGIFTLLTAAFMVLAFSAVTFAAGNVVLKTTVPNIPKSTCYKAGTDTMEFDHLSRMAEGDVIQFTLNNKVTLCKDLNMFLTLGTGALVADPNAAVSATSASDTLVFGVALAANTDIGFIVRGTAGTSPANQLITLELRSRGTGGGVTLGEIQAVNAARTVTFTGAALTDVLSVKLFDGKTASWFKDATPLVATTLYADAIVTTDNIICIDTLTQDYLDEYVQNTPDSLPGAAINKLTFSGDYRIAHIMAAQAYSLYTCKGAAVGRMLLGTTGQSSSNCSAFDFELGTNYCATANTLNRFILQASTPFEATNYTVTMEILVNGNTGARGVYWSNEATGISRAASTTGFCGVPAPAGADPGSRTWLLADGGAATAQAVQANNCAFVTGVGKAVKLIHTDVNLGFVAGDTYLYINMPSFNYNLAEVLAGDVVSVKVTLSKASCGSIGSFTIPIGTFGCSVAPLARSLVFPYFSSLTAGDYWNGIAINNTMSVTTPAVAGTATLTSKEKDGDVCTATITVPQGQMYVNLLENITWTKTSGTACGGVANWIQVSGDFNMDGFGMIAQPTSTGASMGYLPRLP